MVGEEQKKGRLKKLLNGKKEIPPVEKEIVLSMPCVFFFLILSLFTISFKNLSQRMKNKRHAKAFEGLFFWKFVCLDVLFSILQQMSKKLTVSALI